MWCRDRTIFPSPSPSPLPILRSYEQFAAAVLSWLLCTYGSPCEWFRCVVRIECGDDHLTIISKPTQQQNKAHFYTPQVAALGCWVLMFLMWAAFPFLHNSDSRHQCGAEPCAADTQLLFLPLSPSRWTGVAVASQARMWHHGQRKHWKRETLCIQCSSAVPCRQGDFVTKSENWNSPLRWSCQVPCMNSIKRACKSVINEKLY